MKHYTKKNIIKAALLSTVVCIAASATLAEPKTNMMHQWAQGSEAAAIAKLGEMFEAQGGKWEQTAISGHTSNTLAKLLSCTLKEFTRLITKIY